MGYLHDFYLGNKNPQDRRIVRGSTYDNELKKLADLEQRLLDLLLCDGLDLFQDYIMQANTVLGVAAEDSYIEGFRQGVCCLIDVLGE